MDPSKEAERGEPKDHGPNLRRLSLITYLLSRPGRPVSATEVRLNAEGYSGMTDEAFKKRFQEDRGELAERGIVVESEKGDDGADVYWLRREAYYLSVHLSFEETTALAACLAVLDGSFAYAQPVRLALLSFAQDRPEIVADAQAPPLTISPELTDGAALVPKLQAAVNDRKSVRFTYYAISRDEELERVVDPFGLQHMAGEWYLTGRCHLRDDVRIFRLSRIRSRIVHATKAPHDFPRPVDFDLAAYADRPAWQLGTVTGSARVRVDPSLSWWVEAHWSHCGTIHHRADGGIDYITGYAEARPLLSWVLGLGDAAELLQPAGLRARLREQLTAVDAAFTAPIPSHDRAAAPEGTPARPRRTRVHDGHVEVDRFTRLCSLAMHLLTSCGPDEADIRVGDVCATLGITRGQLEEDVRLLNSVGFPGGTVLYAEFKDDDPDALHVVCDVEADTFSRPARLSPLQADALLLAIGLVGGQLPMSAGAALKSAEQKLRAARGHPTTQVSELLRPDDTVYARVNAAIAGHRLLRIEYWKEGSDELTERIVEPYLMRRQHGECYYVCWCRRADGPRVFRVATTKSAVLLDERFEPRRDVELDLYRHEGIPTSHAYAPKKARVWYGAAVARWVEERQPVVRLEDGSCLAEQPYVDEGWLTQHLLPFAEQARLLDPPTAMEHFRRTVRRVLARYD